MPFIAYYEHCQLGTSLKKNSGLFIAISIGSCNTYRILWAKSGWLFVIILIVTFYIKKILTREVLRKYLCNEHFTILDLADILYPHISPSEEFKVIVVLTVSQMALSTFLDG